MGSRQINSSRAEAPAQPPDGETVDFMGLRFDSVTPGQAVDQCLQWCETPGPTRTVMTLNAGLLMMMRSDESLAEANRSGDLILADGLPVVWATRLLGRPLAARVAGVDLMQSLFAACEQARLSVYLLGAAPHVLDDLIAVCAERFPRLTIAGHHHGYFDDVDSKLIVDDINDSGAHMVFIAMPSPRKELWGEANRHLLDASVVMGVGGSFDVVAGHVKRAPEAFQRIGMEWFWRLLMEPRKMWRRYLVHNTTFLYHLGVELLATLPRRIFSPSR